MDAKGSKASISGTTGGAKEDPSYQVRTLIKGIQVRRLRSKQKHFLTNFLNYYNKFKPEISRRDAKLLLYGDTEYKGLVETCGNTNMKTILSLKRSSQFALNVLYTLLTVDRNKTRFRNLLAEPPKPEIFKTMKLHRHIKQFAKIKAFHIISLIREKNRSFGIYDILGDEKITKEAASLYEKWENERLEKKIQFERKKMRRLPKRWADINEDELNLDPSDDDEKFKQEKNESSSEDELVDPLDLLNERQMINRLEGRGNNVSIASQTPLVQTCRNDFDPEFFLATMHADQPESELQRGLTNLERNVNDRLLHMRQLVKQHFDQFVSCKTIIDGIHDHLKKELMNRGMGPSRTARLNNALLNIHRQADRLYKPLIERKQRTDRIRSALEVLKRFRFFFSLPGTMKQHIKKGQYTEAVRLYERSKKYKLAKGVAILHSVQKSVGAIISKFRQTLLKKLQNPHATLEEHQSIIGFLENLDCDVDPTWYYLTHRADWMITHLQRLHKSYKRKTSFRSGSARLSKRSKSLKKTNSPETRGFDRASSASASLSGAGGFTMTVTSELSEKKNLLDEKTSTSELIEKKLKRGDSEEKSEGLDEDHYGDDLAVQLVAKMAGFLSAQLPDLYTLSCRIKDGFRPRVKDGIRLPPPIVVNTSDADVKLYTVEDMDSVRERSSVAESSPIVEGKESKKDISGLNSKAITRAVEVKDLFDAVQSAFTKIARRCIFPAGTQYRPRSDGSAKEEKEDEITEKTRLMNLHKNVVAVTKEFSSVEKLIPPQRLLSKFRSLANDSVKYFIMCTFTTALSKVTELKEKEDFTADEANPSITRLPKYFNDIVLAALKALEDSTPKVKPRWMVQMILSPFIECLRIMADVLHLLAFPEAAIAHPGSGGQASDRAGRSTLYSSAYHSISDQRRFGEEEARRVLVVLANTHYIDKQVISHLWERCQGLFHKEYHYAIKEEKEKIFDLYSTLAGMVEDEYIRTTTLRITGFTTRGITTSGRDWSKPIKVTKVREYVLELLLEMVLVYDDLHRIIVFTSHKMRLMKKLLRMLADSFLSHIRRVGDFCPEGALQVYVEIDFIQRVLRSYLDDSATGSRKAIFAIKQYLQIFIGGRRGLPNPEEVVTKALETTKVMFACFQTNSPSSSNSILSTRSVGASPGGGLSSISEYQSRKQSYSSTVAASDSQDRKYHN